MIWVGRTDLPVSFVQCPSGLKSLGRSYYTIAVSIRSCLMALTYWPDMKHAIFLGHFRFSLRSRIEGSKNRPWRWLWWWVTPKVGIGHKWWWITCVQGALLRIDPMRWVRTSCLKAPTRNTWWRDFACWFRVCLGSSVRELYPLASRATAQNVLLCIQKSSTTKRRAVEREENSHSQKIHEAESMKWNFRSLEKARHVRSLARSAGPNVDLA